MNCTGNNNNNNNRHMKYEWASGSDRPLSPLKILRPVEAKSEANTLAPPLHAVMRGDKPIQRGMAAGVVQKGASGQDAAVAGVPGIRSAVV